MMALLVQPIGTSAISRMPYALQSLAVWPVVNGLLFVLRSLGIAYNEVVVSLLDRPGSVRALRRFALRLAALTSTALLLIALTPLGGLWFARVTALSAPLAQMASQSLFFALILPALSVYQSWYQGVLLHSRRTAGISESVASRNGRHDIEPAGADTLVVGPQPCRAAERDCAIGRRASTGQLACECDFLECAWAIRVIASLERQV
jgi:hypothetical protein